MLNLSPNIKYLTLQFCAALVSWTRTCSQLPPTRILTATKSTCSVPLSFRRIWIGMFYLKGVLLIRGGLLKLKSSARLGKGRDLLSILQGQRKEKALVLQHIKGMRPSRSHQGHPMK